MLSANELLAIDVSKNNEARLFFVGTLLQMNEPAVEIQIQNWHTMIVIVLRTTTSLQVYLTKNDFYTAEPTSLEPIQKINTNLSPADRFVLFRNDDDLLLVTYDIKTETANQLM